VKLLGLALAMTAVVAANVQVPTKTPEYVLFLSGNAQGYLSPCGCSTPMIGGAKRRATAIEKLGVKGRTFLLENGGLVKSSGRQDEIKLETFAQLHAASHGIGMNLGVAEASLGPGAALSMARLSGSRLLSTSIQDPDRVSVKPFRVEGPFLIGAVSANPEVLASGLGSLPIGLETAVGTLTQEATNRRKPLLLLLDGSRDEAEILARRFPKTALIQYQTTGRPSPKTERVGNVILASPGDGGRYLVRLVWKGTRFISYVPVELDPGYRDHAKAQSIYKTYLSRISGEKLLEALPREETAPFTGNKVCISCHAQAGKVWKDSKHALALKTLEKEGHDRDPDCVECHVVGLASIYGFKSRKDTPDLTDVGCESCHGPGAAHSKTPEEVPMGKVGEMSCLPCHRPENSPKFNFAEYWKKIKH
jgi:hypothetical protein